MTSARPTSRRWKSALFLLVLALLVWRVHAVGHAVYHEGNAAQADYLLEEMPDARVIVLGSSHAGMVHLDAMGLHGQNLWDSGQDLHEVEYKARVVVPRLPELETVLISVSYFSFMFDNAAYIVRGKNPRMDLRYELYAAYPAWTPLPGDTDNFLKGRLHALVTKDHWEQALPHLFDRELPHHPPVPTSAMQHPLDDKPYTADEMLAVTKERVQSFRHMIRVMGKRQPEMDAQLTASLERTVRMLTDRGIRVVLFTPPFWRDYNRIFPAMWQEDMRRHVQELLEIPGVEYLDFSHDERFTDRLEWFGDADHLNRIGARRFSTLLGQAIDGSEPASR